MFNNSLWKSKSHAWQPLYIILGAMLVSFIGIPFCIHFLGLGIVFAIDVVIALALIITVIAVGRRFKWNNNKLEFAIAESGIYFASTANNNNSYFNDPISNIAGYIFYPDGKFTTVILKLKKPSNAGVFGNIKEIKMIKIENFDKLQDVLETFEIHLLNISK